jgi:zinc/manganese transport system substrate-binding protein
MARRLAVALVFLAGAAAYGSTQKPVRVVATTSSMGMLARVVGGDAFEITVLSPPDRDAHYLQARPSMMVALRRADLVVAVGADLEATWLSEALRGASNPRIFPGQSGYFEGAAQIGLIETGLVADRSRGDVHPAGNPHYYMDPERMARVAEALARRLAQLEPAGAPRFQSNAQTFARAVDERLPVWKRQAAGAPGILPHHKDVNYLAALLGVPIVGYVEPLPGIPPTAAHLKELVGRLGGTKGVILYNSYHSADGPLFLARSLGWKAQQLQLEVDLGADGDAYLDHVGKWVTAIAGAGP